MAETKFCSGCEKEHPLSAFHRDKTHKDGHKSTCKACRSGKPKEPPRPSPLRERLAGKSQKELETIARSMAIRRLIEVNKKDFNNLLARYRVEVGMDQRWIDLD